MIPFWYLDLYVQNKTLTYIMIKVGVTDILDILMIRLSRLIVIVIKAPCKLNPLTKCQNQNSGTKSKNNSPPSFKISEDPTAKENINIRLARHSINPNTISCSPSETSFTITANSLDSSSNNTINTNQSSTKHSPSLCANMKKIILNLKIKNRKKTKKTMSAALMTDTKMFQI